MPSIKPDHRQALFLAKREMSYSGGRRDILILTTGLFLLGLLPFTNTAAAAYAIQVGAFANPDNAERFTDRISSAGFTVTTFPTSQDTDRLTHVIVGPFPNRATALTA
ncbi:MAG TPA: SPOR domain-containing protein, partial [Gammaproteobacteria bacterium]|nr:SPOR domain-containing protein [Gammaproteobacteria bacterium]